MGIVEGFNCNEPPGNREEFGRWFEQNRGWLEHRAKRKRAYTKHGDDFDDLVQRTMTRCFQKLHTFDPNIEKFSTWVLTILHRLAIDQNRRETAEIRGGKCKHESIHSQESNDHASALATDCDPHKQLCQKELAEQIKSCRGRLTQQQQLALDAWMTRDSHESNRDSAEMLGLTKATYEKRIYRAKKQLIDCLEKKGYTQ